MKKTNDKNEIAPKVEQIKSICKLATIECCYHTVAIIEKDNGKGFLHFLKEKRKLWIQLITNVKIGIDLKKVKIDLKDDKIVCALPLAEIIGEPTIDRKELKTNEHTIIASKDGFIFKNPIAAKEQSDAIQKAQDDLKENLKNNSSIFDYARERAMQLLENYINRISEISEQKYEIAFIDA